jgi:hypothetical protein
MRKFETKMTGLDVIFYCSFSDSNKEEEVESEGPFQE